MMKRFVFAGLLLLVSFGSFANADWTVRNYEHVLGTSCELRFDCPDDQFDKIEATVFAEVERLSQVFNHYDEGSQISQLLASTGAQQTITISAPLREVLGEAESYRVLTGGAFDIRAGEMTRMWQHASSVSSSPSMKQRQELVAKLSHSPYSLQGRQLTRHDAMAWSLDAISKGFILDSLADELATRYPELNGTINIGGDIRSLGSETTLVAITDPHRPAENASPVLQFELPAGWAVCTSGSYRRGLQVNGERYSHIIDPRSGLPIQGVASSTVAAGTAMQADALATAFAVLSPEESIRLADQLQQIECCLIDHLGNQFTSAGWSTLALESQDDDADVADETASKKEAHGLIVDFTLNRPKGGIYNRPYVAVWLEDEDGFPVKTAVLWIEVEQPGPRWHRDLTRWYRNNRMRKAVDPTKLIGTISGATRGAGEYQAIFDGTDNSGDKLPNGKYTLCLEVAREHGTYQLIRERVELNGKAIAKKELKENVEMSKVAYEFKPEPKGESK